MFIVQTMLQVGPVNAKNVSTSEDVATVSRRKRVAHVSSVGLVDAFTVSCLHKLSNIVINCDKCHLVIMCLLHTAVPYKLGHFLAKTKVCLKKTGPLRLI